MRKARGGGGANPVTTDLKIPAKYIMSMASHPDGSVWIGAEDDGVFRFDPVTNTHTRFTTKDGLGDDHAYAVTVDQQGRVWVGHQSRGVSVYNGQSWQNYEVAAGLSDPKTLAGPLGERVFDIAVNPKDGDVWMGTNLGLSRYSVTTDSWTHFTRSDGLPSDQIGCVAIDPNDGTVYAGTQCDGIASAKAPDYKRWTLLPSNRENAPVPGGAGIPTNLINDITVGRNGTVWVATPSGLAFRKAGAGWQHIRGRDWDEKAKSRLKDWSQPKGIKDDQLLLEDYVTTVAEDGNGYLWVGHRQQPYEVLDAASGQRVRPGPDIDKLLMESRQKELHDFTTSFALSSPRHVTGQYGGGIGAAAPIPVAAQSTRAKKTALVEPTKPELPARFPSGDKSPTIEALSKVYDQPKGTPRKLPAGHAMYLGDDWITRGDWVARYGRQLGVMCAMNAPFDDELLSDYAYKVGKAIGHRHRPGDDIRHWIHWLQTSDRRSLYNPCIGFRRQAEWDDHGETYPMSAVGPDLWIPIEVPEGVHRASLYFFNKDGESGHNRFRDYMIELKAGMDDPVRAEAAPALARARVRDFRGGVYKQFVVVGPGRFLFHLSRNHSYNAIVSGVFLDKLVGPASEYDTKPMVYLGGVRYDPPPLQETSEDTTRNLIESLDKAWANPDFLPQQRVARVLAYRASVSDDALENILAYQRWRIPLWTDRDREGFDLAVKAGRDAHVRLNQQVRPLTPEEKALMKGK